LYTKNAGGRANLRGFGIFLMVVGLGWAFGVPLYELVVDFSKAVDAPLSVADYMIDKMAVKVFIMIFTNFLPGLIIAGIGALVAKREKKQSDST
jgi:hypothetical protein